MITDELAEKALHFLIDNSKKAAEARANRLYLEDFGKRLKALIMLEHLSLPVSAQEREALADDRYQEYLEGLREAIRQDEEWRHRMNAAATTIEFWRTKSSNERAARV